MRVVVLGCGYVGLGRRLPGDKHCSNDRLQGPGYGLQYRRAGLATARRPERTPPAPTNLDNRRQLCAQTARQQRDTPAHSVT